MNLETVANMLRHGATVGFHPRGNSMTPLIRDGQHVTVEPVDPSTVNKDDIVLVRVNKQLYLHKVVAVDRKAKRLQIGNNKGKINGWTGYSHVYGRYVRDEF